MMIINKNFSLSEQDILNYRRDGFIKLKNFFSEETTAYLFNQVGSETNKSTSAFEGNFDKLSFDILAEDNFLFQMFSDSIFRKTVTELNHCSLFYTQGLGFEMLKNKNPGFDWHHGNQSFGYIRPEDFGCTMWVPLTEINAKQRGGMTYVSKHNLDTKYMYDYIHPAIEKYLRDTPDHGSEEEHLEVAEFTNGFLGTSPLITTLLEHFKVEDTFDVGDAFLFDKYVFHKSVRLEEGEMDSRKAFVMRFVDSNALYDKGNAEYIDLARQGINYNIGSSFHKDVCHHSGEKISESAYFKFPEKHLIKPI